MQIDQQHINASITEREFLISEVYPKKTGFTPRSIEKLTTQSLPKSVLNIECSHVLRTSWEESTHGHQSLEYQIWLEAGKHDPPFPKQSDESYNANIWRNFKTNYGYHLDTKGRSTAESVAAAYPIALPKPSKVGAYTYKRFLKDTPGLFHNNRLREIAINRTAADTKAMELLQLKSLCRYPPIDKSGNILPPAHYKKHPHYFKPIADIPTTEYLVEQRRSAPPTPYGYQENPKKYQPSKSPAWRFNLKSPNRHYQKVLNEIQNRKNAKAMSLDEPVSRVKTCTPANSSAPSEAKA